MSELYKGYTQHLMSNKTDDETPGAILRMEMIPGLYVMKQIQQEGYVLPVCKYINNLRTNYIGSFPVNTPGKCTHPRFDYAAISDGNINVQNVELIPDTIAGGVVSINNLMKTRTIPRYNDLSKGNMLELEAKGYIAILKSFFDMYAQAYILLVKESCNLVGEDITYNFNIVKRNGSIIDFTATIN